MRSILLPPVADGQSPVQVFIDNIVALRHDAPPSSTGYVYIGIYGYQVSGSSEIAIPVTQKSDADAMIAQINAAMASSSNVTLVPGNPASIFAPESLTATADFGQISLAWTASNRATRYIINRSTSTGMETPYSTSNGLTFVDTSIISGTTYYYTVTATNDVINSSDSSEANATASDLPVAPTANATTATYYESDLTWAAGGSSSSFPAYYNVYRSLVTGGPYTQISSNITALAYNDNPLTDGTEYFYVVTQLFNNVESAYSNEVNCTPTALAAPGGFLATAGIYKNTLEWIAVEGATAYNVYRGNSSGGETLIVNGLTSLGYVDNPLRYDQSYFYYVTATVNNGEGPQSAEQSAQPNPATFTLATPNPASISGSTLTITGTGFDSAQSATLQYGVGGVFNVSVNYVNSTTITADIPGGLSGGNLQFYYIVAGSSYAAFTVAFQ